MGKRSFEERLADVEDLTSGDLMNLQPSTTREHLMMIYKVQERILKHAEDMNGWRKGMDDFQREAVKDIAALKTSDKVLGVTLVCTLIAAVVLKVLGL